MRFLCLLCDFFFNPDEFFYQCERRKFHEAIARGGKSAKFPVKIGPTGQISVDPRDLVVTKEFRDQCEAVKHIFTGQQTASRHR